MILLDSRKNVEASFKRNLVIILRLLEEALCLKLLSSFIYFWHATTTITPFILI